MSVTVELGERRYDVLVGRGVRAELAALIASAAPEARDAAVVAPDSVADRPWFDLRTGLREHRITVPDGEPSKTVAHLGDLVESLAAAGLSRDDVVVAVGGGATTDLVGFAAATYLRGVRVVHVPTTLLAQVDAAIGGKTGVNLSAGKNLMGSFHQPLGVLCDTDVLDTLPERELRSGLGEVAKCWLLEGRDAEALPLETTSSLIEGSVALKARLVTADEREGGARALLNYGHTLAHALEKLSWDGGDLRHGEAVAVGLAFAARLARVEGRVDDGEVARTDAVLEHFRLSARPPEGLDVDDVLAAMSHDKKGRHDLRFVLPGPEGFSLVPVSRDAVRSTLLQFVGSR